MSTSKIILVKKNDMTDQIRLHDDFEEVLLKYAGTICHELIQLRGHFEIDHFSINVIDSQQRLLVFSLLPSVEQSLFLHGLWKHDKSFSTNNLKNGEHKFIPWRDGYESAYAEQLIYQKETKHGFTFGFSICTKIENFEYVYSFATRSKGKNLHEQYKELIPTLLKIGAHGYKRIHHIHKLYLDAPLLKPSNVKAKNRLYLVT